MPVTQDPRRWVLEGHRDLLASSLLKRTPMPGQEEILLQRNRQREVEEDLPWSILASEHV